MEVLSYRVPFLRYSRLFLRGPLTLNTPRTAELTTYNASSLLFTFKLQTKFEMSGFIRSEDMV